MTQYIDKAALVAELERVIDEPTPPHDQQCSWEDGYYCGLNKSESIINTLKVQEVDLEKEIDRWQVYEAFPREVKVIPLLKAIGIVDRTARHFFELGLKAAQKGE